MSKVHEDNAGYVGVSYEETQDPFYSYNKLSLPLSESDKSVIREEVTHTVTQANSKFVVDGTSQKAVPLAEGGVYTFDQSDSSNTGHPLRLSEYADGTHGYKFGIFNGTDARYLRGDGNTILAGTDPFTVEAWIKPNTNVIIGLFDGTSGQAGGVRNYGGNTFAVQGHESTGAVVPTSAIKVGQWQHIAVSYRRNTGVSTATRMDIWVHIDGVRVATGYRDGGTYTVRPTFDIGTINQGGDGKFNGLIRNFRMTPFLVYPDISFTPPAIDSTPATTSISVSSQSKTWGQLNSGGATGSFAEVNPQYIPFTLPSNYDCVDFAASPYPPTGASFTVVFGATGASFDAYYLDLSDNWQSLGTGLSNAANTTRTFTPSTRFKVIRLYSTTGNLGNLEVVNAYNSYDAQNARVSTLNAGLTNTVSGGAGLTNNDVVLGPIEYTTGVTATGTPGQAGAQTKIVVPFGAPDLYYYCSQHPGMGSSAVTPANRFMFDGALPILKTTDAFGETLGTGNNEDPYAANLVLALPMNGANNGTTFTDVSNVIRGSGSAKTITRNGTTTSTAQSIFYGSSAAFDGSDDNLKLPANDSDFQFGSDDFTIETWFNPDTTNRMAIYHGSDGDDHSIGIDYSYITQTIAIWASSNGTSWNMADGDSASTRGSIVVPTGVWTHIAYVRYGSKLRLYINGVLDKEFTNSNSIVTETEAPVIGEWYNAGYDLDGYLADFRIYKGVAKYTSNFVVPDRLDLEDRSGNSNNASNQGVTWQTSIEKFYGGASGFLGGTNTSRVTIPSSNDFVLDGDFTIETWLYLDPAYSNTYRGIFQASLQETGGISTVYHLSITSSQISFGVHASSGNGSQAVVTTGVWHHIAIVRSGSDLTFWVDGSPAGSATDSRTFTNNGNDVMIGQINDGSTTKQPLNGYLQDFRLYKGIAKYSSSFSPPERSVQGTARRYPSGIYVVS